MTKKEGSHPRSVQPQTCAVEEIVDMSAVKKKVLDLIGSELVKEKTRPSVHERSDPSGSGNIRVLKYEGHVTDVFAEGETIDGIRISKPDSGDFRLRRARAIISSTCEGFDLIGSLHVGRQQREASIMVTLRPDRSPVINLDLAPTSSQGQESTVYAGPLGMRSRRVRQIAEAFGVAKPQ